MPTSKHLSLSWQAKTIITKITFYFIKRNFHSLPSVRHLLYPRERKMSKTYSLPLKNTHIIGTKSIQKYAT